MSDLEDKFRENPENAAVFNELEHFYQSRSQWEKLVAIYRERAEFLKEIDLREAAVLFFKAGRTYRHRIDDLGRAYEMLAQAFELDLESDEIFAAIEDCCLESRRWQDLYQVYSERLEVIDERKARLELFEKAAHICDEKLAQADQAISLYSRARELDPKNSDILRQLATLFERQNQWNAAIEIWQTLLKMADSSELRDRTNLQIGVLWQKLGDHERAASYYRAISGSDIQQEALAHLEQIYADSPDDLSLILTERLETVKDDTAKAQMYKKLAALQENREAAIAFYQRALEITSDDIDTLTEISRIFWEKGQIDVWFEYQDRIAEHLENTGEKVEFLRNASEKLREREDYRNLLIKIYEMLLKTSPQDRLAVEELIRLYRDEQNYESLMRILVHKSKNCSLAERVGTYFQIAKVLSESLNQQEAAKNYYQKVLELQEDHQASLDQLKEQYLKEGNYSELLNVIEKKAGMETGQAAHYYWEMGEIYRDRLQDSDKAIEFFEKSIEHDPRYWPAFEALLPLLQSKSQWQQYVSVAEDGLLVLKETRQAVALHLSIAEICAKLEKSQEMEEHLVMILRYEPAHAQALGKLGELYRDQQRWQNYAEILESKARFLGSSRDLSQRYVEIARIYREQLKQRERAIHFYEKAHNLSPYNEEVLIEMQELAESMGNEEKLVYCLKMRAKSSPNYRQSSSFLRRLGDIYTKRDEVELAISAYEQALAKSDSLEVVDSLTKLYRQQGDREKLFAMLERKSRLTSDRDRMEVYRELAQLATGLQRPRLAIDYLEKVLSLSENHAETLESLITLYQYEKMWTELLHVYRKKLVGKTPEQRLELLREMAKILEKRVRDQWELQKIYREILKLQPDDMETLHCLQDLCAKIEDWRGLIFAYRREVDQSEDEIEKAELYQKMGKIYHTYLPVLDKAIECYSKSLEYDRDNYQVFKDLHRLYLIKRDYSAAIAMIDRELQLLADPELEANLLVEKGNLCRDCLHDTKSATVAYEQALSRCPTLLEPIEALETIFRKEKLYPELLKLLESKLAILSEDESLHLQVEMARIYAKYLNEESEAEKWLLKAIAQKPSLREASQRLVTFYHKRENWQGIESLYQLQIKALPDGMQKAQLLFSLGKLYEEKLGDMGQAASFYVKVLKIEPGNLPAIKSLQRIYQEQGNMPSLTEAYLAELAISELPLKRRVALHLFCAELFEQEVEKKDWACTHYRQALKLDPENLAAICRLQTLYREQRQYSSLAQMLLAELTVEKREKRLLSVHLELADIQVVYLDDPDEAAKHLVKAHHYQPQDREIVEKLKKILYRRERWQQYIKYLLDELEQTEIDAQKGKLYLELSDIYEQKLQNPAKAIEYLERLCELDGVEIAQLRRLEKLYHKRGKLQNAAKLAKMYRREIELIEDKERLAELYRTLGTLYEKDLNFLEKAGECWELYLHLAPGQTEARDILASIYMKLEKWDKLAQLLFDSACIAGSDKEKMFNKAGAVWDKKLGNTKKAMGCYQMALTLNPESLNAVQGMRRLAERKKDWQTALDFLYKEAKLCTENDRVAAYLKIAKLWESRMSSIHQAVDAYLQVLKIHFHHPTAEYVLSLLLGIKDYETFCRLSQKVARRTRDPLLKAERMSCLGKVLFQELNLAEQAIDAYKKALKYSPKKAEAISGMEEIYHSRCQWPELAKCKERKLELTNNRNEIKKLHLQLGKIAQDYLFDEKKAIFHYQRALELSPGELFAIHTLQKLYYAWGYFDKYIELCSKELGLIESDRRKMTLLLEIAQTWEDRLFNGEEAARSYEKILELDKNCEFAADRLITLYEKNENYDKLTTLYRARIEQAKKRGDKAQIVSLSLITAKLLLEKLKNYPQAERAFEEVLANDPENKEALAALSKIFQESKDIERLAEIMTMKIQAAQSLDEKANLYCQLGEFYDQRAKSPDKAIEAYQQARAIDPERVSAIGKLQELYRRVGNTTALIEVNEKLASLSEGTGEQVVLYWEIAEFLIDSDPKKALSYLKKITGLQQHFKALSAMVDILGKMQDWAAQEKVLTEWIANESDIKRQSELLVRRGQLYLEHFKNKEKADADFFLAFEKDRSCLSALTYLANSYWQAENWEKAEPFYEQLVRWSDQDQVKELCDIDDLYYKWGNLAERMQNKDVAVLRYQKALERAPEHLSTLTSLGNIYYRNKQWEQALLVYVKLNGLELSKEGQAEVELRLSVLKDKMGMTEGAIEGYLKVVEENPKDTMALQALGTLYWERKQPEKALDYFLKLQKLASGQELQKYTMEWLGKSYRALDNSLEAIGAYEQLSKMEEKNRGPLKELIELYMKRNDWEHAADTAKRLSSIAVSNLEKAENEMTKGKIRWLGYQDEDGAVLAFEKALEYSPTYLPALEAMAEIYKELKEWDQAINSYEKYLDCFQGELRTIPLLLEQAQILQKLGRISEAIPKYQRVLELDPEHAGSHAALSVLLAKTPERLEDAITEHHYLLTQDPMRAVSYHELFRLYLERKDYDHSYLCCQALKALDRLVSEESEFLEKVPPRTPSGWLDAWTLDQLVKESERGALYEIMGNVDPYTSKSYAPSLEEKHNLRRKDRILLESDQQIGSVVNEVMRLLGISEISLYLGETDRVVVENTQPPSLIIGRSVLDRLTPVQMRFVVGHYLFFVSRNHLMAGKLSAKDYRKYVFRLVEGFAETGKKLSSDQEAISRKLRFSIPRKIRKQLEERMDILTEIYHSDISSFLRELQNAANKCGLLFCDSLKDALVAQRFLKNEKPFDQSKELESAQVRELFWFNISEEYHRLRKEMGLLVKWIS